jgi:DNA-binding response OmpR family regulator
MPRVVLVVEADRLVREMLCELVESYGTTAIPAATSSDALRVLSEQPIDAMVAHVGIFRQHERELAREARRLRPGLGIVLTTSGRAIASDEEAPLVILRKPFAGEALFRALQAALGRPHSPAAG